jgi:putative copper resistance protein D
MSGSWWGSVDPATIELAATATRFGHIFVGRFIGLAGLWLLCAFGMRSDSPAVSILAGLLLASLGPVSHAAAGGSDIISFGAISDAAHLLTAGFWLGGLAVLALFLRRHWADRASLLGALRLISIWGTYAVAVLVITGLINAVSIVPVAEMSLHNFYFDLLLLKAGLASAMIGLAALNRWCLAPALRSGGEGPVRHLAGSVGSEIVLGFAVVAIAGLLGLTAPH